MTPQKGYLSQRGTVLPGRLFVCLSTSSIEHDHVTLITSKVCKFVIQFLYTVLTSHPFDPWNDHDKYNLRIFLLRITLIFAPLPGSTSEPLVN